MNQITPLDLSQFAYPPTLPLDVALRSASPQELREEYNLNQTEWDNLKANPYFLADLRKTIEDLKKEGMSFKLKARLQAEEYLKTVYQMVTDTTGNVPPAVRADLIKFVARVGGLDNKEVQAGQVGNALQININLG